MNCDLENSFLLVYLSGPLIIIHGPGPPRMTPHPLSVGLHMTQAVQHRLIKYVNINNKRRLCIYFTFFLLVIVLDFSNVFYIDEKKNDLSFF